MGFTVTNIGLVLADPLVAETKSHRVNSTSKHSLLLLTVLAYQETFDSDQRVRVPAPAGLLSLSLPNGAKPHTSPACATSSLRTCTTRPARL